MAFCEDSGFAGPCFRPLVALLGESENGLKSMTAVYRSSETGHHNTQTLDMIVDSIISKLPLSASPPKSYALITLNHNPRVISSESFQTEDCTEKAEHWAGKPSCVCPNLGKPSRASELQDWGSGSRSAIRGTGRRPLFSTVRRIHRKRILARTNHSA